MVSPRCLGASGFFLTREDIFGIIKYSPTHVHISGDDIKNEIKVDLYGNPLKGESSLPVGAKKAFKKLLKEILKAVGPWI